MMKKIMMVYNDQIAVLFVSVATVSEACWDVIYKHAVLINCFNCPESLIGAEYNIEQA